MLECLIIGDSIAVGTKHVRPECVSYAKSGWNSSQWNNEYSSKPLVANTVIISLGSNDLKNIDTKKELEIIRDRTKAQRVFWILPAIKPRVQDIVYEIAIENDDVVIPIRSLQKDKVHPDLNGYKQIAKRTRE
jgi:lysophospholipase L1-like esterase